MLVVAKTPQEFQKILDEEAQVFPKKTLMQNLMIQQATFQITMMTVKVFFLQ